MTGYDGNRGDIAKTNQKIGLALSGFHYHTIYSKGGRRNILDEGHIHNFKRQIHPSLW